MGDAKQTRATPVSYVCAVLRLFSTSLLVVYAAMVLAPSLFVVHFLARRAYIERELCVQRDVVAAMRTCHGQCHLGKQLRALEQEAATDFPSERLQVRTEPGVESMIEVAPLIRVAALQQFPHVRAFLSASHSGTEDPVPWG